MISFKLGSFSKMHELLASDAQSAIDSIVKKHLEAREQLRAKAPIKTEDLKRMKKSKKTSKRLVCNSNESVQMIELWKGSGYKIKESDWKLCSQGIGSDLKAAREAIRFILSRFFTDEELKNKSAAGQGTHPDYRNDPIEEDFKNAIRGRVKVP